jgi:dTDP-4-amino-4,6-dideoxygalactose transaminase
MRSAYHLFPIRYDESVYGVPRQTFIKALTAEGVPASPGYTVPLYEQPLFTQKSFGPYTGYRASNPDLDYTKTSCPNCERICRKEGVWLVQNQLLGRQGDMEAIASAFEKVYERRGDLKELARREGENVR